MTYVTSDIHGEHKKYIKMLELIDFCDEDTLYILGDVVDRGAEPMEILLDNIVISSPKNSYAIEYAIMNGIDFIVT